VSDKIVDVGVREPSEKIYLGDGLYAEFDGWQVKLWAHDGEHTTNTVYLEPRVLEAFLDWLKFTVGRTGA
jgi:hypothetical protein